MRPLVLLTLLVLAGCAAALGRSGGAVEGAQGSPIKAAVPFSYPNH